MAITNSENEVTVRRLSDVITGTWGKVKELAVSDVEWDSTNNKLTKTKNGTTSDVVTKSNLLSALGGSIASGNTGFVTGGAAYKALGNKAPLESPEFTGTPKAPTATAGTNTTQIATTAFVKAAVDTAIAGISGDLTYKGAYAGGSTSPYGALTPAAVKGDVYKVSTAGKLDGVAVEVGDMLICNSDTAAATSSDYATVAAKWDFIQTNIDGAVSGPASSVNNRVAVFNGTTGKVIKDSGFTIGKSVPSDAVFTDTNTKVTSVENHYTPTGGTSKSASGGTGTQLPTTNGSSNVQVVTGVTVDAAGHVTGVSSKGLWSPNTTYSSQAEAAGGTTTSLCTTGEKYTWNHKQDLITDLDTIRTLASGAVRYDASQELSADQKTQARSNIGAGTSDLTIGSSSTQAAAGNHIHTTTLASENSGSSTVTLAHGNKYKLTAGGTSVIFTMPTDNNIDTKVKATASTSNSEFKILATSSASPTSGNATEAVYGASVTLNPSTNTITANISGTASAASSAASGSALETAINGKVPTSRKVNGKSLSSDITLSASDVGAAASGHTHDTTIASSTGTNQITLAHGGKYAITAGGTSYIFTMPSSGNTDTKVTQTALAGTETDTYPVLLAPTGQTSTQTTTSNFATALNYKPSTNTLAANISGDAATASAAKTGSALETAINGKVSTSTTVNGHALSGNVTVTAADVKAVRYDTASQGLSDTQKSNARTNIGAGTSNLTLGTDASTAAKGNHTHDTSIATSSGTNQITLAASTKYAITAGGTSYVFTTPPNTTYSSKTAASGGTEVSLCTTGEKFTWNNKQDALTEMTDDEVAELLAALT